MISSPPKLSSRLAQLITANPGEEPRELVVSEVVSARILCIGFEPLRQFYFWLPQGRWHHFTLSKVHSVMSFCVHLEAVNRWVVVYGVKRENSPNSFGSGHVPSVLELLNLIVSTGFFNYFHSDPVTTFANILEQVLDPTNTRHTQLYIHVAVEPAHQLRVIRNNPRVVNLCSGFPRTGLGAVSPPSGLRRPYDMSCRSQTAASRIEEAWGSFSCTAGLPCTMPQDYMICTGCVPYAEAQFV